MADQVPVDQTIAPVVVDNDSQEDDQLVDHEEEEEPDQDSGDDEPSTTSVVEDTLDPQPDWRIPFIEYLSDYKVSKDKTEMQRLTRHSRHYVMVDGQLMHRNAIAEVLQKYILSKEGVSLLHKIHAGTCGNHAVSRTLVSKAYRAGFYWPTAVTDTKHLVRHCKKCQFFAKQIHVPAHELQTYHSHGLSRVGDSI